MSPCAITFQLGSTEVKGTFYPLHSPISLSFSLPCVTGCHHISTGVYGSERYWLPTPFASFSFTSSSVRHRVPSHFNWRLLLNFLNSKNSTWLQLVAIILENFLTPAFKKIRRTHMASVCQYMTLSCAHLEWLTESRKLLNFRIHSQAIFSVVHSL